MELAELTAAVEQHFRAQADRYGLDEERVRARYVLNLGGFVNANFTVGDGTTAYHLKLSLGPWEIGSLWRWFQLRAPLAARYHAPPVIEWVALANMHAEGLLFPHIDGVEPDLARDDDLLRALVALLDELHADADLAEALGQEERPARLSFLDTFIERFTSDLDEVLDVEPPPFLDDATWGWLRAETEWMARVAETSAAFDEPCAFPIHGDPWPQNVIATPERWYLTDWDDVAIGDPALDIAIALWPRAKVGGDVEPFLAGRDDGFRARMDLYMRANLLDEAIDTLADWTEAAKAPEHADAVRARKEQEHLEALAAYRARYA